MEPEVKPIEVKSHKRASNPCAKMVKPPYKDNAYEVWSSPAGTWKWYVLKKHQSPEKEKENPFARWYCLVTSPIVGETGEMGDVYVSDIVTHATRIR